MKYLMLLTKSQRQKLRRIQGRNEESRRGAPPEARTHRQYMTCFYWLYTVERKDPVYARRQWVVWARELRLQLANPSQPC